MPATICALCKSPICQQNEQGFRFRPFLRGSSLTYTQTSILCSSNYRQWHISSARECTPSVTVFDAGSPCLRPPEPGLPHWKIEYPSLWQKVLHARTSVFWPSSIWTDVWKKQQLLLWSYTLVRFKTGLAIDLPGKDCRSHNHGGTECDDGVGEMHFGIDKGRKSGGRLGFSFLVDWKGAFVRPAEENMVNISPSLYISRYHSHS